MGRLEESWPGHSVELVTGPQESWGPGEASAVRGSAALRWGSSSGHGPLQALGFPASVET